MKTDKKPTPETKETIPLFEILNDINFKKKGNIFETDPFFPVNMFMVLRFLALDYRILWLVNLANKYQNTFDKEMLYNYLVQIIPPEKRYNKYIKDNSVYDVEKIELLKEYYKISSKEAEAYLPFVNEDTIKKIKEKFGGNIN